MNLDISVCLAKICHVFKIRNKWRFLLFFIAHIVSSSLIAQANNLCAPNADSCDFYSCMENNLRCGNSRYLIKFGMKNCQKYIDQNNHFSKHGQNILRGVRECLQEKISVEKNLTCDDVDSVAFSSHRECYLQENFCSLNYFDQLLVFTIIAPSLHDPLVFSIFEDLWDICLP